MPESSDGWDWEEEDGERAIPHATRVRHSEFKLHPRPPAGWFKFFSYDSQPPVHTPDAGAWVLCLVSVHEWEAKHGRKGQAHMICRDKHGWRLLIVHPDFRDEAESIVETLNGILTGCTCGGYDCIEPYVQNRAARVFARRACDAVTPVELAVIFDQMDMNQQLLDWPTLPIGKRAALLKHLGGEPRQRLQARHWLDALPIEDTTMFSDLAREIAEHTPDRSPKRAAGKQRFALLEAV